MRTQFISSILHQPPLARRFIQLGQRVNRAQCKFNLQQWQRLLIGYVPNDPCYTNDVLLAGIQHGVIVRYEGQRDSPSQMNNHPPAVQHEQALCELLMQELRLGRYIGPFAIDAPPYSNVKISPLNLVEKTSTTWRIINDLSSPLGTSVNDGISWMPCKWQSIEDAMRLIYHTGTGCHLIKMDVKSAYRQIPIHPSDWHLFGVQVAGLLFLDTFLPFGGRSSGCIWEQYGQAMQWILQHKYDIPPSVRFVDDFLFVLPRNTSQQSMSIIDAAFDTLGVPLDHIKTEGPVTQLGFIGYQLNTVDMTLGLTDKYRGKLVALIQSMIDQPYISFEALESLIGRLQFAGKAYRLGRSYMYHLQCAKNSTVKRVADRNIKAQRTRLALTKLHLNKPELHELKWWLTALHDNVVSSFHHYLPWGNNVQSIHIYTDASESFGCGAVMNQYYISLPWDQNVRDLMCIGTCRRNMPLGEAIGVGIAIATWASVLAGQHVTVWCDCTAVVFGINKGRTTANSVMHHIYRDVNRLCITHNITLQCRHIAGVHNVHADNVSRNNLQAFQQAVLDTGMTPQQVIPTPITLTSCTTSPPSYFPNH